MSNNRLELVGMNAFREALRNLPEDLTSEAADIVDATAVSATNETYVSYRERTGALKRGLSVQHNRSRHTTATTVRSRAPHAHLYEKGTGQRRTDRGWNRGVMPAAQAGTGMIAIAQKWRRRMGENLVAMLEKNGFLVRR